MTATCPHCDVPMKKQHTSKMLEANDYFCRICGDHFTKVKGEKGYHKGQILNLPQAYWHRRA